MKGVERILASMLITLVCHGDSFIMLFSLVKPLNNIAYVSSSGSITEFFVLLIYTGFIIYKMGILGVLKMTKKILLRWLKNGKKMVIKFTIDLICE